MASGKKYLLCDWNFRDKENFHWVDDPLAGDMKLFLKTQGWERGKGIRDEKQARLVVLVPKHGDLKNKFSLSLADAQIFHVLLAGCKKHVLLVDRMGFFQGDTIYCPDWLFCIKNCDFDKKNISLLKWLEKAAVETEENNNKPFDINKSKKIYSSFNNGQPFYSLIKTATAADGFSKSGTKLLRERSRPEFFYGLLRMTAHYNSREHDFNRRRYDNVFTDKAETIQLIQQQKNLLDFCYDLYNALKIQAIKKELSQSESENEDQRDILVIDDKPELIKKDLKAIIETFLPQYKVSFWEPPESTPPRPVDGLLLLEDLKNYSSLYDKFNTLKKKKVEVNTREPEPGIETIFEFLKKTRYILVDILFTSWDGREEPAGIQVIKGLRRFYLDAEIDKPMDIIALSRADDLNKVQLALQAGATGYVLKSRLLSLPSILSKPDVVVHESAQKMHRNFRSLYTLPDTTIKHLHTLKIPAKDYSSGEPEENSQNLDKAFTDILTALPKTDLHVHVGSCMSPEFLVVASFIMLLRHNSEAKVLEEIYQLMKFWRKNKRNNLNSFAGRTKKFLIKKFTDTTKYRKLRSILHRDLGISDYLNDTQAENKLQEKPDVTLFLFSLIHIIKPSILTQDDILRCFLLFLAANKYTPDGNLIITLLDNKTETKTENILAWFRPGNSCDAKTWSDLHSHFWPSSPQKQQPDKGNHASWSRASTPGFHERNWNILPGSMPRIDINLPCGSAPCHEQQDKKLERDSDPISYYLASGTRCTNLRTYLEGCEFSGAEHLRHPYLIHLYVQQTIFQFVRQGVMYAELRAAVSGYKNEETGFTSQNACNCMKTAFEIGQATMRTFLQDDSEKANKWLWHGDSPFSKKKLQSESGSTSIFKRFPVKVSLILTGKRHKSSRQMLREAASATVLHATPDNDVPSSRHFTQKNMNECRLVGFDLAGQENLYPPELFRDAFEQLAKMHIPITVHAGENAPAGFVERAILDLRAKRIGHGLSLADDPQLMKRAREEKVCIELCPVSNFQTNQIFPADKKESGRKYPLKKFLENGNAVCLNTDNPVISHTNMIKECFQASYAYGDEGLSLWELLRIFRMGFVHSFLSLPERRAMLELADQIIFDLFSDPVITEGLEQMALAD